MTLFSMGEQHARERDDTGAVQEADARADDDDESEYEPREVDVTGYTSDELRVHRRTEAEDLRPRGRGEEEEEERGKAKSAHRCYRDVHVRDDDDGGNNAWVRIVKLEPNAWDNMTGGVTEFRAVVQDDDGVRRVRGFDAKRKAKMFVEDRYEDERYENAAFLDSKNGTINTSAVAICEETDAGVKVATKTVKWTSEDCVAEFPNSESASVIICKVKADFDDYIEARMSHFAGIVNAHRADDLSPIFSVSKREDLGCVEFKLRSWSHNTVQSRVRDGLILQNEDEWRILVTSARAYIVHDVHAFVTKRPNKSKLPPALTCGRDALQMAKMCKLEQGARVNRVISYGELTLGDVW